MDEDVSTQDPNETSASESLSSKQVKALKEDYQLCVDIIHPLKETMCSSTGRGFPDEATLKYPYELLIWFVNDLPYHTMKRDGPVFY